MIGSDPSIDPITGLPVLNPSGPVQQIPLGQEVFPYADLNATAQPTRGPIYGDDIIPTSSLITAPDDQLKPRSIQSTRTRELRVREAVFQNLGAAIPDGTTAPVDVNVVSGGGGGGSDWAYTADRQEDGHFPFSLTQWDTVSPSPTKLFSFSGHAYADVIVTTGGAVSGAFKIGFGAYDSGLDYPLFSGIFSFDPTYPNYIYPNLKWDLSWPGGLPVPASIIAADNFTIWTDGHGFSGTLTYVMLYA